MKIKSKTAFAIISILLLNICLLLQQANFYQMFHVSNIYRNICLIMVFSLCIIIFLSNFGKVHLFKSQKTSLLLITYIIVIGILYGNSFEQEYWASIDFVLFFLIFISYYEISENLSEKIIHIQSIVFWISAFLYFYAKINSSFYTSGEHSSTMFSFMLLPFCGMLKKKKFFYMSLLCMLAISFFESARTMFIMTCLLFLYNLFVDYGKGRGIKGYLLIGISLLIFLVSGIYMYNYTLNINDTDIVTKTLVYKDSFRIDIYKQVFSAFIKNGLIKQFFGSGFMSTVYTNFKGFVAHNDFLEMLYDYGIVGLVLLIAWFISVFKELKKSLFMKNHSTIIYASFIVTVLMCITNTIFFNFGAVIYMLMFWSFIISKQEKSKHLLN